MPQPINLVGGFYKDPNRHWSAQDVLNWIPVRAENSGTRTEWTFRDAPGRKNFVRITREVEGETVDVGPIRGMRNVEGQLFVVAGTTLYRINNNGVAVPYGTVPGVGRTPMSHNQRGSGNELVIDNGSARYVFNTATLVFQKVTDPGFPGSFLPFFIDGYMGFIEPQGRYWGHSDLADALNYNTFDRYEAEGQPDRIVSALVNHREVLILGRDTIEPYVNQPTDEAGIGPFQRASNTVIQSGCAARYSAANVGELAVYLDDKRVVQALNGYTPNPISTAGIEQALRECTEQEIASAYAMVFRSQGFQIYYLTIPGRFTFGFDFKFREWHRVATNGAPHWCVTDLVYWNGKWIAGDSRNGRLYELDWDYSLDSCDELIRERVTGVASDNQNRITVNELELLFDVGSDISVCSPFPDQPEGPTISGNAPSTFRNATYNFSYTTGGGTPPRQVTLRSGSLPTGLSLSLAGAISGTPTETGMYSFVVRVTDANGLFMDLPDSISVSLPMILVARSGVNTIVIPGVGDSNWASAPISTGGNIRSYVTGIPSGRYHGHEIQTTVPASYSDVGGAGAWTNSTGNVVSSGRSTIVLNGAIVVPGTASVNRVLRSTDNGANFSAIAGTTLTYLDAAIPGGLTAAGMSATHIATTADAGSTFTDQAAHGLTLGSGGALWHNATHYVMGGQIAGAGAIKDWSMSTGITTPVMPVGTGSGTITAGVWNKDAIEICASGAHQILRRISGGSWVLTTQTFTHPVIQLFWSGANFIAVTTPTGGGAGEIWVSPDANNGSWIFCATLTPFALFGVAQEYG